MAQPDQGPRLAYGGCKSLRFRCGDRLSGDGGGNRCARLLKVAQVVFLEQFDRTDRLPHLPFLEPVVPLKVLGEGRQRVARGEPSGPPRSRQVPLQPAQTVRPVPVVHQIPTFPIGVNIMKVNDLCGIHIIFPRIASGRYVPPGRT
jgi:hypothetical protein